MKIGKKGNSKIKWNERNKLTGVEENVKKFEETGMKFEGNWK